MAKRQLNQDPNKHGYLSASIEIEISGEGNRDLVLTWLEHMQPVSAAHASAIHSMSFSPSTDPNLIDLQLTVEADSFKEASEITTEVLRDIETFVHDTSRDPQVGFEPMSRTLTPA